MMNELIMQDAVNSVRCVRRTVQNDLSFVPNYQHVFIWRCATTLLISRRKVLKRVRHAFAKQGCHGIARKSSIALMLSCLFPTSCWNILLTMKNLFRPELQFGQGERVRLQLCGLLKSNVINNALKHRLSSHNI